MFCHHNFVHCVISIIFKYCLLNAHTFGPVKPYIHCHTIFYTFQDLFEHTFVYNHVICKLFLHLLPTLCNKATSSLLFSLIYLISGLNLSLKTTASIPSLIKRCSKLFHCKKGDVTVYEYANWHIYP